MIDLIVDCTILELVSCVILFGSQENARKIFHFVLRLSCLRKFNMRKLRGLRNSVSKLDLQVLCCCCFFVVCYIMSSFASTLC